MKTHCPGCKTPFDLTDEYSGKSFNCPNCQARVDVPHFIAGHQIGLAPHEQLQGSVLGQDQAPQRTANFNVLPIIVLIIIIILGYFAWDYYEEFKHAKFKKSQEQKLLKEEKASTK